MSASSKKGGSRSVHFFGIRHHGVGSARSLRRALEQLQPDAVLIEGPPDADKLIALASHADMRPPVALLIYNPTQPREAAWYPFAVYSPEWQAIQYALGNKIPVTFMDLPQKHQLPLLYAPPAEAEAPPEDTDADADAGEDAGENALLEAEPADMPPPVDSAALLRLDPLQALAQAAGYSDSERWWEHMIEERQSGETIFEAIQEAMTALRDATGAHPDPGYAHREALREAWMRKTIRATEKKATRLAVICGAWHVPALLDRTNVAADDALLKGLPSVATTATWTPWTYSRLSRDSGYGAGITSPGWYQHLWDTAPDQITMRWMSRVAGLLRGQDFSASTAQVIDGVRLAEALAALRGRPLPGLDEMNEAALAVFCRGDSAPLNLIRRDLIIGDALGEVPPDAPTVPLQRDLELQQKALRLKPALDEKIHDFDLRKPNDLARSRLLHRLRLLQIEWGVRQQNQVQATGTFHEFWKLAWKPEFAIAVIEASMWGNTIQDAAAARVRDQAETSDSLLPITALLEDVLLADLPEAAEIVLNRLESVAALTSDVAVLMDSLPALVDVLRYGNVRKTDTALVAQVVDGLVMRVCVGLAPACASLDDDAAALMYNRLNQTHSAITLLQNADYTAHWQGALAEVADLRAGHGLVVGRAVRLLRDAGILSPEEVARRLRLALSRAVEPAQAAAWVEGFLKGSGAVLLYDDTLFTTLDSWLALLPGDTFDLLLPLLRRTFSTFASPERRQIGERARHGVRQRSDQLLLDEARTAKVLPMLERLLGI
ncbi:MAG: DUF5682 family protein [bacterium]|nr:DUF5682 family protein [bacterium]